MTLGRRKGPPSLRPPAKALFLVLSMLALLAFVAPPAKAQYRHRVVLLEPPSEPESAELRARLRGELAAAGFEVVAVPSAEGQDPKVLAESVAGAQHPAAVIYARPPVTTEPDASGELWISDRLLKRTFVLRFRTADPTANEAAHVAVQAVEILKADLAELSVTREPPPVPPPKPSPPPSVAKPAESRAVRFPVELGAAVLPGFGGIASTWTPVLRVGVTLPAEWEENEPPNLDVRARVAALGGDVRVEAPGGEARVRHTLIGLELALRLLPKSPIQPFFLICVDAYGLNVEGRSASALVHTERTWSLATGGGLGLWIQPFVHARARPDLALALTGELEAAWVPTEIRIAERTVATLGSPTALFGAGVVGVF
jgi:hypothetical protein